MLANFKGWASWQTRPCWLLGGAFILFTLWALVSGAVTLTWQELGHSLLAGPSVDASANGQTYVLWHLRLPRVALALLVGAALGLCGALTQGLFRNPLADPSLLGVSSGAACAVALSVVFLSSFMPLLLSRYGVQMLPWVLPLVAFIGALLACLVLEWVARLLAQDGVAGLLLTGVALNALTGAVIGLCSYLATDGQLRSLTFWMLGSLASANWLIVVTLLVLLILSSWGLPRLLQALNALSLGPQVAAQSGIAVRRVRAHVILIVALLCGLATAWCGTIGFIGLVAPHLVRLMLGADQRRLAPYSAGLGALLLLAADTLARTAALPAELPVGIFTALFGAPFFLGLLLWPSWRHRPKIGLLSHQATLAAYAADTAGKAVPALSTATTASRPAKVIPLVNPHVLLRCEGLRWQATPELRFGPFQFSIQASERIAILGPSGAGKSTLLALLAHDRPASAGHVKLRGKALPAWSVPDLSAVRAVLPQSCEVAFGLPVELVIALGRVSRCQDTQLAHIVQEAAHLACIGHRLHARYDTLSGGEKARVQLARVFAQLWDCECGLLLVDEPIAALDPGLQLQLMAALQRFTQQRGHALVAVLHDVNQALQGFDRVLCLKNGVLTADVAAADCSTAQLQALYGVTFVRIALADGRSVMSIQT